VKVRISLDTQTFDKKPSKIETAHISNRIAKCIEEIEIEEFANRVVQPNGRSFSGAVFANGERNNYSWKSQQVFALDIDSGITIEKMIERCNQFNLKPAFIYTTFSSTEKNEKFRVVFVMNESIDDIRVRIFIQKALMKIFPQTDPMTRDAARMMFGGKEIVYSGYDNVITVPDIYLAVCSVIRNGSNPSRDMKQFCKSVGVNILNGYPRISVFNDEKDMPTYEEGENIYNSLTKKKAVPINNSSLCVKSSHMNYLIYFSKNNTKDYYIVDEKDYDVQFEIDKANEKRSLIRDYPFGYLYDNCQLYREAIEGKYWLYHNEMFGLMTNLLQIDGGSAKIKEILNSRIEYADKMNSWNAMKNQILKANYSPCHCNKYCPFINECIHGLNMIFQGKLFRGMVMEVGERKVKSLKQAEKELIDVFNFIMDSNQKGIYIIKAPTGIGKTQLYVNACKDKNLTIAVPTHRLKNEVSQRLQEEGIPHYMIPELPNLSECDKQKLERLYDTGSFAGANIYLKKLSQENRDVKQYLKELKKVQKVKNQTMITTHQKLLSYKDFNDTVIIDEDIIINAMFPMDKMLIGELAKVNGELMNMANFDAGRKIIGNILSEISNAPSGIVHETPAYFMWFAKEIENIIVKDNNIKTNILGFLNSSHFVKLENEKKIEYVHFINKRTLPLGKKIIILSATIDESIVKKVFGPNINFYDIGQVEQEGEIVQITSKSFSKYTVNQDYEGMKNIAEELIRQYNPSSYVITYKGVFDDISEPDWNFFNTAGRNELSGKNISVIGTPHINPLRYFLFSSALGHKVRLDDSIISYQPVSRGNYRFYFQTYSNNDFLREVQFYMIESELMQTVGRARTLKNKCRVLVLSNYPIPGAEFIHIPQKELNKYRNKK